MKIFGRPEAGLRERGRESSHLEIRVSGNDLERSLRILKREVQKSGIMGELKKRRYYEKPSDRLRRKQREARKRKLKSMRFKRFK